MSLAACAGGNDSLTEAAGPKAEVARPTHGVAPTPAQAAAYRAELQKLLAGAKHRAATTRTVSGVRSAHLDGAGSVALARYAADGSLDQACLDDVDAAMTFLTDVDANGLEVK
ncbi:MAG: hypothetical protein R3B48_21295 [Kofleriaceae bacterium]